MVKSGERVLAILEFFADSQAPATLTEICRKLELPPSSATMLMRTLVERGYVNYDRVDRTYMPTIRTALLGIWLNDMMLNDGTILQLMCDLRDITGQTVVLATQSGLAVQYIKVIPAQNRPTSPKVLTGRLRPLLRTSMGYALLSLKTESEVRLLTRRINSEEHRPDKKVRTEDILKHVEAFRAAGYAYSEKTSSAGAGLLAVLIATPDHQPPLVLGVGGPVEYMRPNILRYAEALKHTAKSHLRTLETSGRIFNRRIDAAGMPTL